MSKIVAVIDLGYVNIYMTENVNKPEEFGDMKISQYSRSPSDKVHVWKYPYGKDTIYIVEIVRGVNKYHIVAYNVNKVYKRAHGKLEPVTNEVL